MRCWTLWVGGWVGGGGKGVLNDLLDSCYGWVGGWAREDRRTLAMTISGVVMRT